MARAGRPTIAQRTCAALALVLLAAAIVAFVSGAVANGESTLATLADLIVGVVAGWYVVSRSGAARVAALALAAGAAALLGLGLALAGISLLRAVLAVACAAASVGFARVALHRGRGASVAVAARHGIPHVTVPAGTRNHFALDLGLDLTGTRSSRPPRTPSPACSAPAPRRPISNSPALAGPSTGRHS